MRIADYARKYHISEQAIRARIKRAGYTLDELRQPGSGHFTADGEKVITALFTREPTPATGSGKGKGGSKATGSGGTLAVIRAERDELRTRAAAAETLAAEREKTIQFLQEQIREKDAQISTLAAAAGALRAALPDPDKKPAEEPQRPRVPWFRRLFRKS